MENTAKSTCCPSSIKLGLVPTLNEANGSTLTDLSRKGTTLVEVSSLKQGQRWSCRSCKSVFSLLHIISQFCSTHPTNPRSCYHLLLSPSPILSLFSDQMIPRQFTWNSGKNWNHTLLHSRTHRVGSFNNLSKWSPELPLSKVHIWCLSFMFMEFSYVPCPL